MLPTFRELSTRGKVLAVGCSALLVAGLATATVLVARGSTPVSPSATGDGTSASAPQGVGDGGGGRSASAAVAPR